jgi:hypothetical protein
MENDIVARLRESEGGYHVRKLFTDAADEIERLRAGGCARDQSTTQYCAEAVRLETALEFTTRERDLARREVCVLLARSSKSDPDYWLNVAVSEYATPREVAESREWDLYRKDGTNGD